MKYKPCKKCVKMPKKLSAMHRKEMIMYTGVTGNQAKPECASVLNKV